MWLPCGPLETDEAGHYTTAIVFNSQDGLGYTNRAAAYLKIDK
jgi:hypothetical protein